ncbi:Bucentaur or craniofacial development [Seminavis robusta]|uniref:Bucentaur or craniofacial development n=1 Tax=Seminavis robusta TaxID=568900 RepID=A0A9N8HLI9_9STRA|nr:Bucentaur or craniofacial development [Seminavis robusta]|eukprot:Sro813_g206160.1 Bucentaur or craniofacial development (269) ;mRNA; f:13166-13972
MTEPTASTTNDDEKKNDKNAVENSEEEDDEDYNPEQEKEEEDGDEEPMMAEVVEEETTLLAPAQKRAVDQAFQDLFGYAWGTSFQLPRRRGKMDQKTQLLVQALGPMRAARILQTGASIRPSNNKRRRPAALQQQQQPKWTASTTSSTASQQQQQQSTQYETKLFAGQKIQVAVQPGGQTTTVTKKPSGGIDSVLQQIAGHSKISTVAKTSADWDSFKTETGLEAELEKKAQGKDAFLVKQDFLGRVDGRKFELEKEERDRERSKRGT